MANTTNSRISNLISSQVPFFVRNDHETFMRFIEAYYEYLEQSGKTVERAKNMPEHRDVDSTIDEFAEHFHHNFLKLLPKDRIIDQGYILKHIKDFYRARGSEKSVRFLMRLLFGKEVDFYYPQRDVLKTSAGNWYIEKSIKVSDIRVNNVSNSHSMVLSKFIGRKITGASSNAFAIVEKTDTYYDSGSLVNELKVSGQYKDFTSGELISGTFFENGIEHDISANLYSGVLNAVTIVNPGTSYQVGDTITITSNSGSGGLIVVSGVTTGNLRAISVSQGGAGFRANNQLLISGGGGSGATGNVLTVLDDGSVHPNSYNIGWQTIGMFANVALNAANFFASSANANINTTLANALSTFVFGNTGPILTTWLYDGGDAYTTTPTVTAQANSRIRTLGILGKMRINDGGTGYYVGDYLRFDNILYGFGSGANAWVTSVGDANTITGLEFITDGNEIAGGVGYDQDYLPTVNVVSSNASAYGANIEVLAVLGTGETLTPITSTAGIIESLTIVSRGSGYETEPTLDLTSIGDGTAQATVTIITGTYTYPGRYINDDGHLSGYNFLQDEHYYQPFSYVVKATESIESYRKVLKELLHPAGMKLFGEYMHVADAVANVGIQNASTNVMSSTFMGIYRANNINSTATLVVVDTTRDPTGNVANVYVEFASGNTIYLANGIYVANVINTVAFDITVANSVNSTGIVYYTSV